MLLTSEAKALSSDFGIISAIQYATQASIYSPESTAAELTTAQTIIISFLYALKHRDLQLIKKLLEVSSTVPQIKSTFLSVWLRDDFSFPRGDVAICLSTLGKLLLDGLQFPWTVAAILASLDVKYRIQECFVEADDTAGQILLSTMNPCVSQGTQVDFAKELLSKESQTISMKNVSFQLPTAKKSTGTQAGLIVHDRGVSVKPEQSTTGVQTTREPGNDSGLRAIAGNGLQTTPVYAYGSNLGVQTIPGKRLFNDPDLSARPGNILQPTQANAYGYIPGVQTMPGKQSGNDLGLRTIAGNGLQTTPVYAYGSVLGVQTMPGKQPVNDPGLRAITGNGLQTTLANAHESTLRIQTMPGSANDSGLRNGIGNGLQPTSVNASGSLLMHKRRAPLSILDQLTGRNVIEDYLPERICKKDPTETPKTISSSDSAQAASSLDEVKDGTKNLNEKIEPVLNKERPISKGMANELLYSAIQKDDTKSIVTAINAGANVNDKGVMKKRPLHVAASAGRIEPAIELIHWGADVDSLDNWEETPLFVASVAGHLLMAEVLVAAGANINHRNSEGNCPLHVAASAGQLEIVCLLLSSGAEVDCRGQFLRTPLHCAASRGHLSVVGQLLDRGADPLAVERSGHTPLSLAKSNQQNLVAEFLHYRSRQ